MIGRGQSVRIMPTVVAPAGGRGGGAVVGGAAEGANAVGAKRRRLAVGRPGRCHAQHRVLATHRRRILRGHRRRGRPRRWRQHRRQHRHQARLWAGRPCLCTRHTLEVSPKTCNDIQSCKQHHIGNVSFAVMSRGCRALTEQCGLQLHERYATENLGSATETASGRGRV